MLLTVAALPDGWAARPTRGIISDDVSSSCSPHLPVMTASVRAEADFSARRPANQLDEIVGRFEVSRAKLIVDSFRAGIGAPGCTTWTLGGPGLTRVAGAATAFPIANVADETVAVHWKASSGPPVAIDVVLIRKAGVLCLLTHIDRPSVDAAESEQLARAAAAKLG